MNILLLGATGRTGKLVLKYALEKGYTVSCLARRPGRIASHPNLSIFEGNPTNIEELKPAISDCDITISVLDISRTTQNQTLLFQEGLLPHIC